MYATKLVTISQHNWTISIPQACGVFLLAFSFFCLQTYRGRSAAENIYSSFPSMTESIKEKMTLPEDIGARKRGQYDGGDEVRDDKMRDRESRDEEIMLHVKDADQMTGTFSTDPGKMGGEGMGPA